MQKIFAKRSARTLVKNLPRYLALIALIIASFFIVVCMTASANTIISGTEKKAIEDQREDGQFTTFIPLTEKEEQQLTDTGISLEKMFYVDYKVLDTDILRVFQNREKINLLRLKEGRLPENADEIALANLYSMANDLQLGDHIEIAGHSFEICGMVTSPDYEGTFKSLGDSIIDNEAFGTAFVTEKGYENLKKEKAGLRAEEYLYAYLLNNQLSHGELKEMIQDFPFDVTEVKDPYFQEFWKDSFGKKDEINDGLDDFEEGIESLSDGMTDLEDAAEKIPFAQMGLGKFSDGISEVKEGTDELEEGFTDFRADADEMIDEIFDETAFSNLETFIEAEDNPRIGCAGDDAAINLSTAPLAGAIVMILFSYVMAVFVTNEIERDNCVIGTLYALGVRKKDLLIHYLQLPVIITFIASLLGYGIGISDWAIEWQSAETSSYFSIPDLEKVVPGWLPIYTLIIPALVAALVNILVISKKLSKPALSMIRNESKQRHISKLQLNKMGFVNRFRIRQLLREFRSAFAVVFALFITYLLLTMSINCYVLCDGIRVHNNRDIAFEYMYTYKYPEEEVPENGTAVCGSTLKIEDMGYKMDVTVMGIEEDNPYFDLDLEKNESDVTISDSIATKFRLKVGDSFMLEDQEKDRFYAFRVDDIIPYSPSFLVFMDIDEMRDLMGVDEDYFNIVLSDEALDIPAGKLYNIVKSEDIINASDIFVELMGTMVIMLLTMSILVFVVVMFLMMRVMIDRSAKSISLMRILGYKTGEIRKLYLDGNFLVVAIGAAIALPAAKKIMDALYPYFISNAACAVYLDYPAVYYLICYLATLILYIVIDLILMNHINKIKPAEVLSNRE